MLEKVAALTEINQNPFPYLAEMEEMEKEAGRFTRGVAAGKKGLNKLHFVGGASAGRSGGQLPNAASRGIDAAPGVALRGVAGLRGAGSKVLNTSLADVGSGLAGGAKSLGSGIAGGASAIAGSRGGQAIQNIGQLGAYGASTKPGIAALGVGAGVGGTLLAKKLVQALKARRAAPPSKLQQLKAAIGLG